MRLLPRIWTELPGFPLLGETLVTTGEGRTVTVKAVADRAVPNGVVIEMGPEVALAGTVADNEPENELNAALIPLNWTEVMSFRLSPWICTEVPAGPVVGVKLVIRGD